MLVTEETFHVDMLPLNVRAWLNTLCMSVTEETSQDDRSPLKSRA